MSGFTEVENKNAYRTSDPSYWYIRASEVDYLFSTSQLEVAHKRALKNKEDIPVHVEPEPDLPEIEVIPMPEIEIKPKPKKESTSYLTIFVSAVILIATVVVAVVLLYQP